MVAKVSRRAEALMEQAVELPEDERALVADAIKGLAPRGPHVADRHAVIAARVAEVRAGNVAGFSVAEVERSLREELDF